MDEAKSMITVGKYNENIVNLQGVCFDMPDGCNLENVRTICNYLVFRMKSLIFKFKLYIQIKLFVFVIVLYHT